MSHIFLLSKGDVQFPSLKIAITKYQIIPVILEDWARLITQLYRARRRGASIFLETLRSGALQHVRGSLGNFSVRMRRVYRICTALLATGGQKIFRGRLRSNPSKNLKIRKKD